MKEHIIDLIKNNISIHHIHIDDNRKNHTHHIEYAGGGHYKAIIVSDDFKDLTLLKRHQKVYEILGELIKNEIHAFSMQTLTIEEYKTKKPDH